MRSTICLQHPTQRPDGKGCTELSGCLWTCPAFLAPSTEKAPRGTSSPSSPLEDPPLSGVRRCPAQLGSELSFPDTSSSSSGPHSPSQTLLLTCSQGRRGRPTSPRGLRTNLACRHQSSCGPGNRASDKARNWVLRLVLRRAAHRFPLCQPRTPDSLPNPQPRKDW